MIRKLLLWLKWRMPRAYRRDVCPHGDWHKWMPAGSQPNGMCGYHGVPLIRGWRYTTNQPNPMQTGDRPYVG